MMTRTTSCRIFSTTPTVSVMESKTGANVRMNALEAEKEYELYLESENNKYLNDDSTASADDFHSDEYCDNSMDDCIFGFDE